MSEFVQSADGVGLFVEKLGAGASTVIIPNSVYMRRDFARLAGKHTVILFDMRNRGQSGVGVHPEGVWGDVEDIEAIRAHFSVEQAALIGHSYLGLVVALYAMRYPQWVTRVIQVSPAQPSLGKPYVPPLSYSDEVLKEVWAGLQAMESQRGKLDPVEFCQKWWKLARPLFVMDPAHVEGIRDWGFCELTNERNFMKHWIGSIVPSLQKVQLKAEDFARVVCPVLTIHGTHDRSAPYGGGKEWADRFPHGRLLTVEGIGHVPWVEAPQVVWPAMESFLSGAVGGAEAGYVT